MSTLAKCRHCQRRIEEVEGVGWLHPDPNVYWVPAVEPQCASAEPVDTSDWEYRSDSADLGICDAICPDHHRHCDAYGDGRLHNANHPGPHSCSLCDHWIQRNPRTCADDCPYCATLPPRIVPPWLPA